jgi:predicted ATP-grasp superfamily ATP-dependent carboligase
MTRLAQNLNPAPKGAVILGGSHGSLEIARSLGRQGIPICHITADDCLTRFSRYIQVNLPWRGPSSKRAVDDLIEMARDHGLEGWTIFAGSDADLRFLAQNHSTLESWFKLTTPPWDITRFAYDKRWMHSLASSLGIDQPRTFFVRERRALSNLSASFPVILKPTVHEGRNSFVDAKAWRADTHSELLEKYDAAKSLVGADAIMIQELIAGDGTAQFSYAGVWHRGRPIGSLVARRRRQYPVDFGFTSTFVETVEQREVEAAAERFLSALNYGGLVEMEFKRDGRDGLYKLLDVNARAWTWMALGAAAGVDFSLLQHRLAIDEAVSPAYSRTGVRWLYASRDIAASLTEMAHGRLSVLEYLQSLRNISASAAYAGDDLAPALIDLPLTMMRVFRRRLRRKFHVPENRPVHAC